jgi:hypothetical protein
MSWLFQWKPAAGTASLEQPPDAGAASSMLRAGAEDVMPAGALQVVEAAAEAAVSSAEPRVSCSLRRIRSRAARWSYVEGRAADGLAPPAPALLAGRCRRWRSLPALTAPDRYPSLTHSSRW